MNSDHASANSCHRSSSRSAHWLPAPWAATLAFSLLGCGLFLLVVPATLLAQSPSVPNPTDKVPAENAARELSAIEAVSSMEKLLVDAIARAEKSVVSIARLPTERPLDLERLGNPDILPAAPFVREPLLAEDPERPDFLPADFASGVVIDARGLILTNYHALKDVKRSQYIVWVARKPYPAKIKAADPWLDLAVLEIAATDLTPMPLGNARQLKKGQIVVSLGNPYAIARDGEPSAAWGIISNLSRATPVAPQSRPSEGRETLHHYGTLIQTDARLEFGSSGGAIVNLKGEMVGLTTSLAALAGFERPGGFAIPVDDDFKRALSELKQGRLPEYGFLGVAPSLLTPDERRAGKLGARIADVVPATPAAKAGLAMGDIVTHVGEVPVIDDLHLIRLLSGMFAGSEVTLTVERGSSTLLNARKLDLEVLLSKKRVDAVRPPIAEVVEPAWRGLEVDYATATTTFREQSRDLDPAGCVGIVKVERDSPAWQAGLRPGDFITQVTIDGESAVTVDSPKQFRNLVARARGNVKFLLTAVPRENALRIVAEAMQAVPPEKSETTPPAEATLPEDAAPVAPLPPEAI